MRAMTEQDVKTRGHAPAASPLAAAVTDRHRDRGIDRDRDPPRGEQASVTLQLAVILPTLNERGNLRRLEQRLSTALQGIEWEAIFVDDNSRDGTADEARAFCARLGAQGRACWLAEVDAAGHPLGRGRAPH